MGLTHSKYPPKIKNGDRVGEIGDLGGKSSKTCGKVEVVLGVNGVAMDRHGLILWENEATGSKKVFRYLLDLRDATF